MENETQTQEQTTAQTKKNTGVVMNPELSRAVLLHIITTNQLGGKKTFVERATLKLLQSEGYDIGQIQLSK